MDLFLNLTEQRFVTGLRDASSPRVIVTQDNKEPIRLYLVRPSGYPASGYPFMFDPLSGDASVESPVISLCNPGESPLPLTQPALLTPIKRGFFGVLDLATTELGAFLGALQEREVVFSLDAVIDGRPETIFQARLLVRPDATGAGATSSVHIGAAGASESLAVTASGTTDLAPATTFIQWFQHIAVTPGGSAYTHKVTLDSARAIQGATFALLIDIPSGAHPPTIEIYDNSVSGALLQTVLGDTDNAVKYRFEAVLDETNHWTTDNAEFVYA